MMNLPTFTVLMVEDLVTDRELYRRALRQDSSCVYDLLEVESVAAGLALCRTRLPTADQRSTIDVILLDYLLPDANGLDFIERLAVQTGGLLPPVVMISAYGNEQTAVRAIKLGADDYLVKNNLTTELLVAAIRNAILRGRGYANENARLQQQLQQQEQRFRVAVEKTIDCFGIYSAIRDRAGQIVDFRFDYLNAAAMQHYRITAADMNRTMCELFPALRKLELFAEYCQVVETGIPLTKDDLVFANVFGNERLTSAYHIHATKLDDGMVISWRDITEQKQLELSLAAANRQMTIWENITDAYLMLDRDWRFTYANATATQLIAKLLESPTAEIIGEIYWDVFPSMVGTIVDREYHRAVTEPVSVNFEFFYQPAAIWLEIHAYPSTEGLGIYVRDITERKPSDVAQLAAESERDRFFDVSIDLLVVADFSEYFVRVNPACKRILGFTCAEMLAQPYLDLMHPDDRATTMAVVESLRAGNAVVSFENRYRCKDGSYRWLLWSATPDLERQLIYASGHDLTDRKIAEFNDRFLYELAQRLPQFTTIEEIQLETLKSVGKYLDVDRVIWFEVDPAQRLATIDREWHRAGLASYAGVYSLADLIFPAAQAALSAGKLVAISDVTADPLVAPQSTTYQQLGMGAFINIPCILEGRWVATLTVSTITARSWQESEIALLQTVMTQLWSLAQSRTLQALRAQEQQTRAAQAIVEQQLSEIETIYQTAPVGLCFVDTDLRFVRLNERLAQINALPVPAHIGHTIREVLPTADLLEPLFRQVIESGEPVIDLELNGIVPSQPELTVCCLMSYYPLKDAQGRVVGINAMVQDITERQRSEAERQRDRAALEERNRELDSFVYVVSHDLKAPLRAVTNLSKWIEEELEEQLTTTTRTQMTLLRNRVDRMSATIDGLLDYARIGSSEDKLEPVAVARLLAEVIDTLAPPPTFTIDLPAELPTLSTKHLPLFQVFVNLIGNGIKHHHSEAGTIQISIAQLGDFYEFAIADDGPGIAPGDRERMFQIFQAVNPQNRPDSTGIGLAIVKKIVEAEGGTIWLESELGKGTTFYFTWPKR